MQNRLVVLLACAALGAAVPAAAAVDMRPYVLNQVTPEISLLTTPSDYYGPATSNISIIEQSDGFVVVDTGLSAGTGRTIVDFIRSRSRKPVKAVVITHWHNDHPQGASAIREAWPKVRIIATPETKAGMLGPAIGPLAGLEPSAQSDAEILEEQQKRDAELDQIIADPATPADRRARLIKAKKDFAVIAAGFRGTYIVPPTETFTDDVRIDDSALPVEIKFLGRANTAGDAMVWLPEQRILMSGDAVVWPTPFGFFSFPADWVQTLNKVKALNFALLIPGHGEPQTDMQYIDQLIGSIEDIRAQVGPLAKQGLSLEEVGKKVDFSRYAEIFGKTERMKALFKAYWTDPMIENAWKEAKGLPIKQGEGEVTVDSQSNKKK